MNNEDLKNAKNLLDTKIEDRKNKKLALELSNALMPLFEKLANDSSFSQKEIIEAISKIEIIVPDIESPKIEVPEAHVNVVVPDIKMPEINIPEIKVPAPQVSVNVPDVIVPKIDISALEELFKKMLKKEDPPVDISVTLKIV